MKKLLFSIILSALAVLLFAQKVDEQSAMMVAANWFNKTAGELKYSPASITKVFYETEANEVLLYIFNMSNDGFIIISGDYRVQPVLGWSTGNAYDPGNTPPQLAYLIEMYREAVKLGDDYKEETVDVKKEWETLSVKNAEYPIHPQLVVGPLLRSKWGQGWSFNRFCPADSRANWGLCPVGCVATAMAQIMYYWKYPNTGQGSNSYNSDYGTLSANFGATTYMWSQMNDTVGTSASALLSYHCGIAVDMNYGPDDSWSTTSKAGGALIKYFGYSDGMGYFGASDLGPSNILMKQSLDLGRPIIISGAKWYLVRGHTWVIDGYTDTNLYHHNFGWEGRKDDWYSLLNVPDYTTGQHVIINIYPTVPLNITLNKANTTGTYTALRQIAIDPGFSSGTSKFVAQIYVTHKSGVLKIFSPEETIIELAVEGDYTEVFPDLWNGIDKNGNKVTPGEYRYEFTQDDMVIESGTFVVK